MDASSGTPTPPCKYARLNKVVMLLLCVLAALYAASLRVTVARLDLGVRTGNRLFLHAHARLEAACAGKIFVDPNLAFYTPPYNLSAVAYTRVDADFDPGDGYAYHFDFASYRRHRALLRRLFRFTPRALPVFDVAVHVRLDDIATANADYGLLPARFYRTALRKIKLKRRIAIVAHPIDAAQRAYLRALAQLVQNETRARVTIYSSGSISRDFEIIAASRALVASTSTFWFWPSFLSKQQEVYVPAWGLPLRYRFCEHLNDVPTSDGCVVATGAEPYTVHLLADDFGA
jgi:hypothetical protein